MTALARPDVRLHESWAATVLDFGSEQLHGSGIWHLPEEARSDVTEAGCQRWVDILTPMGDDSTPIDRGWVHCTYFWITDDAEVIGFIALRHRLNEFLLEEGGHIGYSIRPSRRREGHASRALVACLGQAAELGIDSALVTCDDENDPSRRTIEHAGGVLEDVRGRTRRYWVPTG